MRRLIEAGDMVLIIFLGFFFLVFLFLFQGVDCMWLELIRVGGGACNTVVGLEFGLIHTNPLILHFLLNFHVINANSRGSFGQNSSGH